MINCNLYYPEPLEFTPGYGKFTGVNSTSSDPLESLWERLLSGDKDLVISAYALLEPEEQQAVVAHLRRMAIEPGWQPEQRGSALAALAALGERYFEHVPKPC
jgi:hypothetical protein